MIHEKDKLFNQFPQSEYVATQALKKKEKKLTTYLLMTQCSHERKHTDGFIIKTVGA